MLCADSDGDSFLIDGMLYNCSEELLSRAIKAYDSSTYGCQNVPDIGHYTISMS
jgi:hypothetical protein